MMVLLIECQKFVMSMLKKIFVFVWFIKRMQVLHVRAMQELL